jgi:hypothetical protein
MRRARLGRIRSVGAKAIKYGPQVGLLWKYAGAPVTDAAQRSFASQFHRRTALKHADTVTEGAILMVMDAGEIHWVVFSGGKPVAAYPSSPTSLEDLVEDADLSKKMTPDQFRARQAEASRRQKVIDAAQTFRTQVRRRHNGF